MKVGIIGVGRIGGNLAAQWARRGHDVLISFKRNRDELAAMADAIGARWGSVGDAVDHGDVIVVSVPWPTLDAVANDVHAGDKVLIDTTNQYAAGGVTHDFSESSAAEHNAHRFATSRLVKAFNTYTAGFQTEVGDGRHSKPVAMFLGGADDSAKGVAALTPSRPATSPTAPHVFSSIRRTISMGGAKAGAAVSRWSGSIIRTRIQLPHHPKPTSPKPGVSPPSSRKPAECRLVRSSWTVGRT